MRGWELASGVAVGLLAGLLLRGGCERPPPSDAPAVAARQEPPSDERATAEELTLLRDQLASERSRRAELESQLAAAKAGAAAPKGPAPAAEANPKPKPPKDGWPDEQVLSDAGVAPADIDLLKRGLEKIQLERLQLRDQATREGWLGRPRYRRRMQKINQGYEALRDELGDDVWDWVLYASGRNNRVVVNRVLDGSAAQAAGLEPGDIVIRYDDRRVFDVAGLRRATTSGRAGETVPVDVQRDGQQYRYYLPRGPLGLALGPLLSVRPKHSG